LRCYIKALEALRGDLDNLILVLGQLVGVKAEVAAGTV
jgi:hypothetical protein